MTSLTTVFAMVPLLFTSDMGSEMQKPLSIAMIGELFDHSLDGFRRDGVIVEVVAHGQLITGKNLLQ